MKCVKEKVFHAWKTGTFPSPATKTLGIKTLELSEGRSLVEMMVDQNHHNMSATMHGGHNGGHCRRCDGNSNCNHVLARGGLDDDGDEDQLLRTPHKGTRSTRGTS